MASQYILISETDFSLLLKNTVLSALKEFQPITKPDNTLLTQLQTAEFLKISIPTLMQWKEKKLIPYTQIGRKIFFKKQDVLQAIDTLTTNKHKG